MIVGKHPMLLNVTYIRPSKRNNNRECFEVVYKDDEGQLRMSEEPAEADIYIVKPEFRDTPYTKPQERIERMDKVREKISRIRLRLFEEQGDAGKEYVRRCFQEKNVRGLNQAYRWPYAYLCDFQPEYYFMKNWYEKYSIPEKLHLSKAFIDIEVDQINSKVDMDNIPDSAQAPVNCVTVILEDTNESYTFILHPKPPPKLGLSEREYRRRLDLYERQLKAHNKLLSDLASFIKDLHDSFDATYGYIDYNIRVYDEEIDLIADIFRLINTRKPDFCEAWNMRFDIQYLYYRIRELGYDPASVMCHRDFESKRCYFTVDRSTFKLENQYDYFYCSAYTQYIDQMRIYAAIRKSRHKLKSVKLNAIADIELKDKKVEYPDETNIITFAYVDWLRFIKYNIKDVLLQKGIERKTNDVITYYMRSQENMTPYNKIFRETYLLRNVRETYFEREGWVQSNNLNAINGDEDELSKRFYSYTDDDDEDESEGKSSYKGAINADPIWNDHVGMYVLDEFSNVIFINSIDYDMAAFYPSLKIASNMDPSTLIAKASFNNQEFISGEYNNRSLNQQYIEYDKNGNLRKLDFTGEAINTYVSNNMQTFLYNYLNIPDIKTIFNTVQQKRTK